MQCPHCDQETDPTLAYCMKCGEQLQVDAEAAMRHLQRDEDLDAIEFMEGQTRGAFYACAFLLVCIVAFRLIVVRTVVGDVAPGYFGSARPLAEKNNLEPPVAVDVPVLTLEIPDWRPTK